MVRKGFSPFACVFTRADHVAPSGVRFFPFTAPRGTADIQAVRAMMDVLNMTGNTNLQFAYLESDNPELFTGTATVIEPGYSVVADGAGSTTGYQAITLTKAYVVFGVVSRNNSNSNLRIELCWVSTRFDTRAC